MQIQDHSQIKPTFTCPDVANVTSPFLVWSIRCKVPIQQIGRDVELVITVCCSLMFARSDNRYTVLTHQTPDTTVADIQANVFQLLSHSWPAIAAQAETRLFFDVGQRHHIRSLLATSWPTAERTQTAHADANDIT